MLIKNTKPIIDPDKPFEEDILGRLESAEILTQLLKSIDEPFVLAIDSGWGTGKTVFIESWSHFLRNDGFHCLYFNAWENDFSDDPLISFIGEIQSSIESLDDTKKTKARKYFDIVKKSSYSLAKHIIPTAAKIATSGMLNLDSLTEEAISDLSAKLAQERIDRYETDKESIKKFRDSLEEFAKGITDSESDENKPLVFFIDELDRCKPTYAVELLERVKHLFNVPGIIFVLALDKAQLGHSIKSLYGTGMDEDGYLRRFVDLYYQLPEPPPNIFCNYLYDKFNFKSFFEKKQAHEIHYMKAELLSLFAEFSRIFGFSLRVQEQCFTQLSLVLRTIKSGLSLFPSLLVTLIALKAANHSLYKDYVNGNVLPKDILDYIRTQPKGVEFLNEKHSAVLEAYIIGAPCEYDELDKIIKKYESRSKDTTLTETQKVRTNRMLNVLRTMQDDPRAEMLTYLVEKIEIYQRFISTDE